MIRFNCHAKPIIDERFRDAINDWAKATAIDARDVFKANGWHELCPPLPLSMIVNNPINTSVFEEAEVIP